MPGESAAVICRYGNAKGFEKGEIRLSDTADASLLPLETALEDALDLFLVLRNGNKTVIAGYPWFLDWGLDTVIFLRGAIAAGRLDAAEKILAAFAAFEENGTLPNIIYGDTAGNRDTADAQLWFSLCVKEWIEGVGGGKRTARRLFMKTVESIIENYVKGTPNGIRVDMESGLVWTPSHFTWMDTNYPACTPRCGYPVDIQAMWISVLRFAGGKWNMLADKAAEIVTRLFAGENGFADCLDAWNGEPAEQSVPDFRCVRISSISSRLMW